MGVPAKQTANHKQRWPAADAVEQAVLTRHLHSLGAVYAPATCREDVVQTFEVNSQRATERGFVIQPVAAGRGFPALCRSAFRIAPARLSSGLSFDQQRAEQSCNLLSQFSKQLPQHCPAPVATDPDTPPIALTTGNLQ